MKNRIGGETEDEETEQTANYYKTLLSSQSEGDDNCKRLMCTKRYV